MIARLSQWVMASRSRCCVALVLLCVSSAVAQLPTGTILGDVKDTTGSVVPGAKVTATNIETSLSRTVSTGSDGAYRFSGLSVGNYEVKIEKEGFRIAERKSLNLTVGGEVVLNIVLEVGAKAEVLEVHTDPPVIDTTSSSLGGLVSEQTVADLPLNGRNFIDLTLLLPGVSQLTDEGQISGFMGTTYSSNGAPVRSNNVLIDGTSMVNFHGLNASSVTGTTLGLDGVKEYQVVTNMFKAEFGMAMGSQTNIVTKSGTNNFHGAVFEYLRNSALDARNYYDYLYQLPTSVPGGGQRVPEFQRTSSGLRWAAPFRRTKRSSSPPYEGLRQNLGNPLYVGIDQTLPANCFSAPGQIMTTNNPCALLPPDVLPGFPGNATGTVAPQMVAPASLYPYPNLPSISNPGGPADRFIYASNENSVENYGQARFDHSFSTRDNFFVRYTIDNSEQDRPRAFPQFGEHWYSRGQYLTGSETHILSPSVLNTARMSFTRTTFVAHNVASPEAISATTSPIEGQAPQFAIAGVSAYGAGSVPGTLTQNLLTWSDDIFWTKGKHAFKFGALVNHFEMISDYVVAPGSLAVFPNVNFFLNGLTVASVFQTGDESRDWRFFTFGFYGIGRLSRDTSPYVESRSAVRDRTTVPSEADGKDYNVPDLATGSLDAPFRRADLAELYPQELWSRVGFAWDSSARVTLRCGADMASTMTSRAWEPCLDAIIGLSRRSAYLRSVLFDP